ncbi:MAG: tetratricopeptide repeat protein [Paracoccaceae bacterium]
MLKTIIAAMALSLALAAQGWAAGSSSSSVKRTSTYDTAVKAVDAGQYRTAIPLLKKVVAKNPKHYDALNYLGFSHRQLGDYDTAFAYYKKVLTAQPRHRGANEYLGELYLKLGKPELAKQRLAVLRKACKLGCEEYDDLKAAIEAF